MQHNHADMSRDQNGTGVYFARDYQSNLGNTMGRSYSGYTTYLNKI